MVTIYRFYYEHIWYQYSLTCKCDNYCSVSILLVYKIITLPGVLHLIAMI